MVAHHSDPPEPDYDGFVEHPRYGCGPRITGLNPKPYTDGVLLHWNSMSDDEFKAVVGDFADELRLYCPSRPRRIPNTAIAANLKRQTPATCQVTHYFDLARHCVDCKRQFIFFAQEQKHWYEELGFGLDSDCIRCVECRKKEQGISRHRETYDRLFHVPNRSVEENLQMAEACLALIEGGFFTRRKAQTVRMLLNAIRKEASDSCEPRLADLLTRLAAAEASP